MSNINIELGGYTEEVLKGMVAKGYVKTKTEAIRLALYEFDQRHNLTEPKDLNLQDALEYFRGIAKDVKELDQAGRKKLAENFAKSKSDVLGKYDLD